MEISKARYKEYIDTYEDILRNYWHLIEGSIIHWKNCYEWPPGTTVNQAVVNRNRLERLINRDLLANGFLTKKTFDEVVLWGFNKKLNLSEQDIVLKSKEAFNNMRDDLLYEAACELTKLEGVGISTASKILALSNQNDLGIYDSRVAHGLSDLTENGVRLILNPPGRSITGDRGISIDIFCSAFQVFNWVLRFFRALAKENKSLCESFERVADIEIAFFSRSRSGYIK